MRVLCRTSRQHAAAYPDPSHLKGIASNAKCPFHNFPRTLSHHTLLACRSSEFLYGNTWVQDAEAAKSHGTEAASLTVQTLKLSNVEPGQDLDGRPPLGLTPKMEFFLHIFDI